MSKVSRRNHSAVFKAKMALAANKGEQTVVQLALENNSCPAPSGGCPDRAQDDDRPRPRVDPDPAGRAARIAAGFTVLPTGASVAVLNQHRIRISMDSRGVWRDSVLVERLWKSIKYEDVYLHAHESVSDAKAGLSRYVMFYKSRRPHRSLDRQTPHVVYCQSLPHAAAA